MKRKRFSKRVYKICYKSAGIWAMFSIWLSLMFVLTYGQLASARGFGNGFKSIYGGGGSEDAISTTALTQFYSEVGLYSTNAASLLALALILAVFRPVYRFWLMGVSAVGTLAVSMGLLEKIVYYSWSRDNTLFLLGERVKTDEFLVNQHIDSWSFVPATVVSLGPLMMVDIALVVVSAGWALGSLEIMRRRRAAVHALQIAPVTA